MKFSNSFLKRVSTHTLKMNKKSCIVVNKSLGCKFIWFSCIVAFLIASSILTFAKSFIVSMLILLCVLFWLFIYCLIEIDLFTFDDSRKWSTFTPFWSCYTLTIWVILIVWFFTFVYPSALNSSNTPFLLNLTPQIAGKSSCTNNANAVQVGIAYNPNGFLSYTSPGDSLRPFLLCPHPNLNWANNTNIPFNGPLASTNKNDYSMNLGKGITDGWGSSKLSTTTSLCPRVQTNNGVGMPICTQCTQEFIRIGKIPSSSNAAACPHTSSVSCNLCPGYDSSSSWDSSDQRLVASLLFAWLIIITLSTPLCIFFQCIVESKLRINKTQIIPGIIVDPEAHEINKPEGNELEFSKIRKRTMTNLTLNGSNFQTEFTLILKNIFTNCKLSTKNNETSWFDISEIDNISVLKWIIAYCRFLKLNKSDQTTYLTQFEKIIQQLDTIEASPSDFFPIENIRFLKYLLYDKSSLMNYKDNIDVFQQRIQVAIDKSDDRVIIMQFMNVFRIDYGTKTRDLKSIGFELVQFLIKAKKNQ